MNTQENIFEFYRKKIDKRYTLWSVLLGLLCLFLFLDQFFTEEHWILNGLQSTIKFISLGLAINFWLNRESLLTHLDHRYADSAQRFEDFIFERENKGSKLKRDRLYFFGFLLVIMVLSIFVLIDKSNVAFCGFAIIVLPLAYFMQTWMFAQDKKLLQELKKSLQGQALDMST